MSYEPQFDISPALLTRIERITILRERIQASAVDVTWIPAVQVDARARNAHSSTAIEGNPLTLEQVRAIEEGRDLPAIPDLARKEAANYLAGIRFIEKHATQKTITNTDILKLHRILASDVMNQGEAGAYRTTRVRVGSYFPPRPDEVPELMTALLEWWNRESGGLSPVISSAILHYRFEAIHPFADGNGRTGRALALWELYRRDFDTYHIFAIDEFYWEDRPRYYKALQNVRLQNEDLSSWLEYTAEGLELALQRVWIRIREFSVGADGARLVFSPRQEQLLQLLRDAGPQTPRQIWDALGLSRQGAMNIINPLLDAGFIVREGTRKSGRYRLR